MLMHARNDDLQLSHLPWPLLVSEKLNGWRCLIAGNELLTKSASRFPNKQLRSHLADALKLSREGFCLDGELYSPRLSLKQIQSLLQSPTAPLPDHLQLYVFDCLTLAELLGSRAARFERRYRRYTALIAEHAPAHVIAHPHTLIHSQGDLLALYHRTLARAGEGLMLRSPAGSHHRGRVHKSASLLWKMKPETMPAATETE